MQLEAFVTFALDYFLEKAQEQGVDANTRHTTSEQLVFIYNESLTSTDKEQGLEFSMALFRRNLLKLKVLQSQCRRLVLLPKLCSKWERIALTMASCP
jgi:hypothetical protein